MFLLGIFLGGVAGFFTGAAFVDFGAVKGWFSGAADKFRDWRSKK